MGARRLAGDFATAEITAPVLKQTMVALTGASHVVFRNLHFDLSRSAALTCSGGTGLKRFKEAAIWSPMHWEGLSVPFGSWKTI